MEIVFETERLIVRQFTTADYDNFFLLHGNPDVMKYIRAVKTREQSDAFLDQALATVYPSAWMGRWAVELKATGEFVGNFVIVPIPDDPEKTQLGYSFTPGNWGKGFATEVTKAGLEYFRNKTPLTEIYAVTESPHIASQKVLQKAGFQQFGKKMEGEKELTVFIVRR